MARPWYTPVEAPAGLRHLLACTWTAAPSGRHLLTPDGCTDLLWLHDGTMVFCGPETRSWSFELSPGTSAVGVRFLPAGAHAVFDLDLSRVRDRRVPVALLIGHERAARWSAQIAAAAAPAARRDRLASLVGEHARGVVVPDGAAAVVDALAGQPFTSAEQLARQLDVSPRTLHRHACRWFGYGTATLARLVRFHRFLAAVALDGTGGSLAAAAATAGYYDQAHLARDCRGITGLTAAAFLADHFPTFPDLADPYKTAAPLLASIDA